jgi:putative PIN family toxin of toxin-antitoxin system
MDQIKVLIDTNVLYAGLYSSRGASYQVLRAIEGDRIRIALSTTLLFECEDVLKRNQSSLGLSDGEIEAILDDLCSRSEHQKIYFLWRPKLSDPKDDHILELAIASGIATIVTHNLKDFAKAKEFGIRVITPRQLLEEIR